MATPNEIDKNRFRKVLGHYPTGVSVVTATTGDGEPVGMVVGSFTSMSLDPPLVAFMPSKTSTSWPAIRDTGSFCANVLSEDQEELCQVFATSGGNKFEGVPWTPSASGSPILDGIVAWVDCDIEQTFESGDHYIVVGRVRDLDIVRPVLPLAFLQGSYGRVSTENLDQLSLSAHTTRSIAEQASGLFAARAAGDSMAREIADLIGRPRSDVQEWFTSRDRIVDRLLNDYLVALRASCVESVQQARNSRDAFGSLIRASLASVDDHRAAVIMFQNERGSHGQSQDSSLTLLERELEDLWTNVISQGIADGTFRSELDPKLVFRFIRDAAFMAARWYRPEGRLSSADLADQYTQLLLEGVMANAQA